MQINGVILHRSLDNDVLTAQIMDSQCSSLDQLSLEIAPGHTPFVSTPPRNTSALRSPNPPNASPLPKDFYREMEALDASIQQYNERVSLEALEMQRRAEEKEREMAAKVEKAAPTPQPTLPSPQSNERYEEAKAGVRKGNDLEKGFKSSETMKSIYREHYKEIKKRIGQVTSEDSQIQLVYTSLHRALQSAQSIDPSFYEFCCHLIAHSVVKLGSYQFHVDRASVPPYAKLLSYIMQQHPTVHLYYCHHTFAQCPFAIPFYPDPSQYPSIDNYKAALGYTKTTKGEWEDIEKFEERMNGIFRLYACILSYNTEGDHPLGIDKAWTYLAETLNQHPIPLAPTLLQTMIMNVQEGMIRKYGKQYHKMIQCLLQHYIPLLYSIGKRAKPATLRLEECLQTLVNR